MKHYKQKLAELNNNCNTVPKRKRPAMAEPILLFIAQVTAETNGNIKWLIWIAAIAAGAGIGLLIALALRGL